MARTTRKRIESFERYYAYSLTNGWFDRRIANNDKFIAQLRAKYYGKTERHYTYGLPKGFRKQVNQQRRALDKRELHKEMTLEDYAGNYCQWNGKSNNSWGYW